MNQMTQVAGTQASPFRTRYDNFIGGKFVAPIAGRYIDSITPITGAKVCEVACSCPEDVELALDTAHAAKDAWGKTSAAHRPNRARRRSWCWPSLSPTSCPPVS